MIHWTTIAHFCVWKTPFLNWPWLLLLCANARIQSCSGYIIIERHQQPDESKKTKEEIAFQCSSTFTFLFIYTQLCDAISLLVCLFMHALALCDWNFVCVWIFVKVLANAVCRHRRHRFHHSTTNIQFLELFSVQIQSSNFQLKCSLSSSIDGVEKKVICIPIWWQHE